MSTMLARKMAFRAIWLGALASLFVLALVSFFVSITRTDVEENIRGTVSERFDYAVDSQFQNIKSLSFLWLNCDLGRADRSGGPAVVMQEYLAEEHLRLSGLNGVAVINAAGAVVGSRFLPAGQGALAVEEQQRGWAQFLQRSGLFRHALTASALRPGYVQINSRTYLVQARQITRPDCLGLPGGTLIIARDVLPQNFLQLRNAQAAFVPVSRGHRHTRWDDDVDIWLPLPAVAGLPQIALETAQPLQWYGLERFLIPMRVLSAIFIIIAVIWGTLRYFDQLVTQRILGMKRQISRSAESGTLDLLVEDGAGDEISGFIRGYNRLLKRIETLHDAEREARRLAVEALGEAQKAERVKSDFVAVTSHEIRTPLSAVLGHIDLLADSDLPEREAQNVARLKKAAQMLKSVIDDVLDFSRLEQGALELESTVVELGAFVRDVADIYHKDAEAKSITLNCELDADEAYVFADGYRLQQVLGNLISNAIKFTAAGGVNVRISRSADRPDWWHFAVIDTGMGIAKSQQSHLFEPFTQVDSSMARRFGGSGLGLSICRRIVTAMGGTIGVQSLPDAGSTFWFEVPLPAAQAPAVRLPVAHEAALPGSEKPSLRLLVVEDNQLIRDMFCEMLHHMGHQPYCVANGLDAVNVAAQWPLDAVLMDMQMPIMDGLTATAAIRALGEGRGDLPIFALTADADMSRRHLYDSSQLDGFMTKPFSREKLEAALAAIPVRQPWAGFAPIQDPPVPLLDPSAILEIERHLGMDMVRHYLADLRDQFAIICPQIREAVERGDMEEAHRLAHSLRGAASSLGASGMHRVLLQIERLRKSSALARRVMKWLDLAERDTTMIINTLAASKQQQQPAAAA